MELKRLIGEIHRRSLWQVMAIYLGASWLVLQVTQHVVAQFQLPEWTYGVALLLLLLGLPIVLATAFVQEGPPGAEGAGEQATPGRRPGASRSPATDSASARTVFTWRNALMGAVGASALWGVVAAGWLLVAPSRGEEAGPPPGGRSQITALDDEGFPEADEADTIVEEEEGPDAGDVPAGAAAGGARPDAGGEPERPPPVAAEPSVPPRRRPAPARAEAERERREYASLLEAATGAGSRARAAGAEARGLDLGTADSLLDAARGAADAEDLRRAQRDLASARALYDDAARRAEADWRRAADSAARAVEVVRARAPASAPGYGEAERHRGAGAAAAAAGDFRLAVERYREAEADYARAAEAPAPAAEPEAADEEEPSGEAEGHPGDAEARGAIDAALARLERALETEDLDALRAVWVTMDAESARNFDAFFDRIRDFDVEIRVEWESLATSASRLAVTGVTTWSYYDQARRERVSRPPFEQRFELARRDGEWVVIRY